MKYIDIVDVKSAIIKGILAVEVDPTGSILLKDLQSGEAVIIGIVPSQKNRHGKWIYWDGWSGNHDLRIDDATCSLCGYRHPTVYPISSKSAHTPSYLLPYCPHCGAEMKKE